jgi:hypothetical protein
MDHEMIDNIKKIYINSKVINFIDEIMFSDVHRLSIISNNNRYNERLPV